MRRCSPTTTREWGVPLHDDRALFELLTLEGAQAGLSWRTMLDKRDAYRDAFHGFDIAPRRRHERRATGEAAGRHPASSATG